MKQLSSKVPVKTIVRTSKGVINEPFEIYEVEEFKHMNKTRKIHYPMLAKKYQIDKIDNENMDDFRQAMSIIVRRSNDELFDKFLNKNTTAEQQSKADDHERAKNKTRKS